MTYAPACALAFAPAGALAPAGAGVPAGVPAGVRAFAPAPAPAGAGARACARARVRARAWLPRLSRRWAAVLLAGVPALLWLAAPVAVAHPLGNFTVNRYDGLMVRQDRVDDAAVVDTAEIPTLQAMPAMDTDGDGRLSTAEAAAHARSACAELARGVSATATPHGAAVRPGALHFRVAASSFRLVRGQAGLDTGRLECGLAAPADLGTGGALRLTTGVDASRIGWHEITARGDGVRIGASDVPAVSVSDELRRYPADLLSNPLDARGTHLTLGAGPGAALATTPGSAWPAAWYAALDQHLSALTDRHRLTLPVGLLAVAMAMVLGAGHAALPGHGKTIMAAYLAGRQGRPRDAVTVATTVTLTHTASVLLLGLALSISSALVGENVLAWLGTASGLVITAAGLWLLPAALRGASRGTSEGQPADRTHGGHDHRHAHSHDHAHHAADAVSAELPATAAHSHGGHDNDHAHVPAALVPAGAGLTPHEHADHLHSGHDHDHAHEPAAASAAPGPDGSAPADRTHGGHDHRHAHSHDHAHHAADAVSAELPATAALVTTGAGPAPEGPALADHPHGSPAPGHGGYSHGAHGHGHGHAYVPAAADAAPGPDESAPADHPHVPAAHSHGAHGHAAHDHQHGHSHGLFGHHHHGSDRRGGRGKGGLIGIGIAGGLVPSPSALVVLLGSIALGRTAFGVVLVVCYGLGMAGTLAAAGLLLLTLRDRVPALSGARATRIAGWAARFTPMGAALLILAVGLGTTLRALPL